MFNFSCWYPLILEGIMYKYKDETPNKTVDRIKQILNKFNIKTLEIWNNQGHDLYSVRISIVGMANIIRSGGKGGTADFALASGYGELIERLENQILYPLPYYYEFDNDLFRCEGFCFSPDEKKELVSDLDNSYLPTDRDNIQMYGQMNLVLQCKFFHDNGFLISIPYYDLHADRMAYMSVRLNYYLYGSNGMCSGNTPEEALVQGLSEILERYVNRIIILEELCPPDIDDSILSSYFPEQYALITRIQEEWGYNLIVKDCSLDQGFPVIAVILIDQKKSGYFVKFGAHPDMRLALERCLTEMFQLRSIDNLDDLLPFEISDDETAKKDGTNLRNIFHNGAGMYHADFFKNNASHSSEPEMYERIFNNNSDCLHFLLNFMKSRCFPILIRDVGFLGFPAFHVISPGISEINTLIPSELDLLSRRKDIRKDIKNMADIDTGKLAKIGGVLEEEIFLGNNEGSLSSLSKLPFRKGSIPEKIKYRIILVAINIEIKDYKKAISNIRIIIKKMNDSLNEDLIRYFKCLRDYLCIITERKSTNDDMIILERFYSSSLLQKIKEEVAGQRKIFSDFPIMPCPSCNKCAVNKMCVYEKIQNLHAMLKQEMAIKYPDQSGIKRLLAQYQN